MFKFYKKILNNSRQLLLSIFIISFLFRIAYITTVNTTILEADCFIYDVIAKNILSGNGNIFEGTLFPLYAHRPPGYPLFMAIIYYLSGASLINIMVIQSIIGALLNILLFKFGEKLFNRNTGFLSAIIGIFYPYFIYLCGFIYPTLIFSFLLVLSVYCLCRASDSCNKIIFFVISGCSFGYATLAYSASLLLMPFLIVWYFCNSKLSFKKSLSNIIILILCSAVFLLPWGIRNYNVLGKFLLTSTNGGINFLRGTYNDYEIKEKTPEHGREWLQAHNELDVNKANYNEAKRRIIRNPIGYLKICLKKPIDFWNPMPEERKGYAISRRQNIKLIAFTSYGSILILAIFGMIKSAKAKRKEFILLLMIFAYFTALYTLYFPIARFRIPIEPFLIIFASYAITSSGLFSKLTDY